MQGEAVKQKAQHNKVKQISQPDKNKNKKQKTQQKNPAATRTTLGHVQLQNKINKEPPNYTVLQQLNYCCPVNMTIFS